MILNRRRFIRQTIPAVGTVIVGAGLLKTTLLSALNLTNTENTDFNKLGNGKTILLLSGWQDVNIGDIAHTPGLLNVLQTFLPEAKIILWKRSMAIEPVKELLHKNFPNVKVIYGDVDDDKKVTSVEVLDAFKESDIMIHGSGPSVQGQKNLEAWVEITGKPFGIFGVTIQSVGKSLKELLLKASFIYPRETASLKVLLNNGISGEHVSFVPDATFFMDIRNDNKAESFLEENGLERGNFICVIPRLRYTPYYKFTNWKWSEERIKKVDETNLKYMEEDHAKLREAMICWVRKTGNKILVCPEVVYEVDIMDELLIDPLPEDVKPYVVKRGYWMPDEAASVYRNAHSVLSFECHSPIIALTNGTPAFYLRQPEDTIKGQMYYDLGYDDWIFEIMDVTGGQIADKLMDVHNNYAAAKKKIEASNKEIRQIYTKSVEVI
ncbi:Polysaccharide pyruvyl transferase family protein WcaK [Flaviramulus basaltis]|uniref:Polysaccharide pyruvyl transferase family protein WcaK n=1 Tax=Flaviramulus basaltis TaxID=369401 RepID=A0A1K2IB42_9FLAO|nr:polysaccharide pyruvyl transferase family protein [Flaviramulus basaltis]SFZ89462.1 Polysaccharide pyruvyl transferase family protein WcaK [Flaviramulus basaltis]